MKKIVITGGTDGVGKGLALHYLQQDAEVTVIGTSEAKAEQLRMEAAKLNKAEQLHFIQANLSLVSENKRVSEILKEKYEAIDGLILCAASLKPQAQYVETAEGLEFTFALYYVSRYVLSYELKGLLDHADMPFVVNVAAPGMKGQVQWDDLQFKQNYNGQTVQFHGSRLNDLLGVQFTQTDQVAKIRYILFNPMAVRTPGAAKMFEGKSFGKRLGRLYYKLFGKDVAEIVAMIAQHVNTTTAPGLHAFKQTAAVPLTMTTFNEANASKLSNITAELVK
jgi:NAD(P)-dependent dehydrogenase (short-subunit alcohol dehydrogenase family)